MDKTIRKGDFVYACYKANNGVIYRVTDDSQCPTIVAVIDPEGALIDPAHPGKWRKRGLSIGWLEKISIPHLEQKFNDIIKFLKYLEGQ